MTTTVYIPYRENGVEAYSLFPDRDLQNGYELRFAAYKTAWSKCLRRIQELIHALHAPIVDRVAELINSAYTDTLPGLPYVELPVISVTVLGTASSIFNDISARLESEGRDGLFDDNGTHVVTHLFPQDCPNISAALKTLITGFIKKTEEELGILGQTKTCKLLVHGRHQPASGSNNTTTRLVLILHDFEQFDPIVVQDLFEITSLAIPKLPLVFILSMASPPTPSYIHTTYPRSTLSRLQLRSCSFSATQDVLHDIFLKTFFDVKFDPDLVLGPPAIEFLADFFGRHSPSLDGLLSILQLAHMKHFEEPLTVFLSDESITSKHLAQPSSGPFLDYILARIQSSSMVPDPTVGWVAGDVDNLLVLVRNARVAFRKKSKSLRVAFQLLLLVQHFMTSLGVKSEKTLPELMCAAMRGRLGTPSQYLCSQVKNLQAKQLDKLLSNLHEFFVNAAVQVQETETDIISQINTARSAVVTDGSRGGDVAGVVGDWLLEYFRRCIVSLEELPLWDIWYSGSTPFPAELLNPSLRASIFSGLLHPQDYGIMTLGNADVDMDEEEALLDMPDTSILFQRYLESGKMINVFDWFESFAVVLEAQKRRVRQDREVPALTPTRRKGMRRQKEDDQTLESCPEESEEELEKWRMEVQARFIRSLHELDYVGFIKHTGRKADHLMRTVFDVPG